MRASELPYDVKQQVLQQIESQLGSDVYQKALGSLGEDGLIDSILPKQEETPPQRRSGWGKVVCNVVSVFLILLFIYGLRVWQGGDQWWNHAAAAVLSILWAIWLVWSLFSFIGWVLEGWSR